MDSLVIGMIIDEKTTKLFKGKTTIAEIVEDLDKILNMKDQSDYIKTVIPASFKMQVLSGMLQAKDMETNTHLILEVAREIAKCTEQLATLGGVK